MGGENLGLDGGQGRFCVRVDDYAGKARRYSHIRRVEVSSVVDGGDRPEGDRNVGGGQFRTSTGRCVTNSVTRAIFATDRGHECIRTGRCDYVNAMKRIMGNLWLIDKPS